MTATINSKTTYSNGESVVKQGDTLIKVTIGTDTNQDVDKVLKEGGLFDIIRNRKFNEYLGEYQKDTETTTEKEPETVESKDKIKVVIDAGHGGSDSGATGNGMAEKNMTLAIVLAAKKSFDRDDRFQVSYTRTSDSYPSLSHRANLANNKNADMFLCIHINSASASAHGTETLWSKGRNSVTQKKGLTSRELATAMQSAAVAATGFTNRGLVDRPNLYVLKHTKMPACLIEYGFISNKTEAARMKANTTAYGKALYKAVVNLMKKQGKY